MGLFGIGKKTDWKHCRDTGEGVKTNPSRIHFCQYSPTSGKSIGCYYVTNGMVTGEENDKDTVGMLKKYYGCSRPNDKGK